MRRDVDMAVQPPTPYAAQPSSTAFEESLPNSPSPEARRRQRRAVTRRRDRHLGRRRCDAPAAQARAAERGRARAGRPNTA